MTQPNLSAKITPRERVKTSLRHVESDRTPMDFLATMEIWDRLIAHLNLETTGIPDADYYESGREALLRHFEVDCRVLSYDMFCAPPAALVKPGSVVD